MNKFLLCKHDYHKNVTYVITSFESIENAHFMLEEILDEMQTVIQGSHKYIKSSNLSHLSCMKYGMFVLTYNNIRNRYTVIERKRIEGYVYNSYKDELLCDLFIINQEYNNNTEVKLNELDQADFRLIFTEILNQFMEKIPTKDT